MFLRELNTMTKGDANAARVHVFVGDLYGGWFVYINGQCLQTIRDRRRVFSSLDSVAALLKRANITRFTVDQECGSAAPVLEVPAAELMARAVDEITDAVHVTGEN